jgi:adenylate kinase family enzyme
MSYQNVEPIDLTRITLEIFKLIARNKQDDVLALIDKYAIYTNKKGENIFQIRNQELNNIFMSCCKFELKNAALIIITNYYPHFKFDLGSINIRKRTALMMCIENNMFDVASELLKYPDSLPELNNNNVDEKFTALQFIANKKLTSLQTGIPILVKIITYYLDYNPASQLLHEIIDNICDNQELKNIIQRLYGDEIDFNKICLPIKEAQTTRSILKGNPDIINTRSVTSSRIVATPFTHPQAIPINPNDDIYDEIMYGRNVRQRHNGGKPTRRKRVKTYASKNKTKSKYRKHRKNKSKRMKRIKK